MKRGYNLSWERLVCQISWLMMAHSDWHRDHLAWSVIHIKIRRRIEYNHICTDNLIYSSADKFRLCSCGCDTDIPNIYAWLSFIWGMAQTFTLKWMQPIHAIPHQQCPGYQHKKFVNGNIIVQSQLVDWTWCPSGKFELWC